MTGRKEENDAFPTFRKPVRVWVGLGFPRQLNSVVDAYQFVIDWCGNSPEQKAAIRACKAALAGEIDAETARGIFVQFARRKDILVEQSPRNCVAGFRPSGAAIL
ncbi:DUF982 domain-containing protein [Mesorhizobium sp. B2-7-1]|uniref:DUF982 domain-containing protein n=1 Tax=Mesorhizobium sp. B2-7-1 TaxID=2589909 RepID=UPI00112EEB83|nr:DUF982 domain-containing protein [Mesorhizobium sp. B2-7-1]TPJ51469.1 DUF982 domain-containing protein [Mesorhizobium sp. B2-7-1]